MKTKKTTKSKKSILDKFLKNKKNYIQTETGTGVHDLVKDIFEYLGFSPVPEFKHKDNMTYVRENHKSKETNSRADFILNYKGTKIVVEVEKLGFIEKNKKGEGFDQIKRYLKLEQTPFGILTDGEKWYLYNKGYENNIKYYTIEEILDKGKEIFETTFATKEYYIEQLKNENSVTFANDKEFLKSFHYGLFNIAEKLLVDFEVFKFFEGKDENVKLQIIYNFLIQFILLKILQDKIQTKNEKTKNFKLLNPSKIISLLKEDKYADIIVEIFKKELGFLGELYVPYHLSQDELHEEIERKYLENKIKFIGGLDSIQVFLDLYIFVHKFDFSKVKFDIFGAIYENYLKELYKDNEEEKGQVFTPPEIVEFMLDNIGYTTENLIKKLEKEKENIKEFVNGNKKELKINGLSIIDPACGSGTFLYKASARLANAINKFVKNNFTSIDKEKLAKLVEELLLDNVVGFDIEAFPLFLAEMNILQILGYFCIDENNKKIINKIDKPIQIFSTNDSITEFLRIFNPKSNNIEEFLSKIEKINENKEEISLFENIKRNEGLITKIKLNIIDGNLEKFITLLVKDKLITIIKEVYTKNFKGNIKEFKEIIKEIEKTKNFKEFEQLMKNLEKENKFIEDILKRQGFKKLLTSSKKIINKFKIIRTKFDYVIANPPYVQMIKQGKRKSLSVQELSYFLNDELSKYGKTHGANINIYHEFIALGYALLKNNGNFSYIIPGDFISQLSATQIRNFLKEKTTLNKIFYFGDTKLFIERGITGNISVATTSCIINFTKTKPDNNIIKIYKLKQNKDSHSIFSTIEEYIKNKKRAIEDLNNYLFDKIEIKQKELKDNWKLNIYGLDILDNLDLITLGELEENSKGDIIISKSTEIDKRQKITKGEDTKIDGKTTFNFLEFDDIYVPENKCMYYYDIDKLPCNKNRKAPLKMLKEKKYRIIWNKINSKKKKKLEFMYNDYPIIWHNNGYYGLGTNNENTLKTIFGFLISRTGQFITKNSVSEQHNTYQLNTTDIRQVKIPNINNLSQKKEQVKAKIIKYVGNIVEIYKFDNINNFYESGDIDFENLSEIPNLTIKSKYKEFKEIIENQENSFEDIVETIKNKYLKKIDLLVYCLYFGKENPETNDYIDLTKINIDNILDSKNLILQNKYVKIVEGIENNECNNKKEKKANLDNTNKNNLPDS